MTTGERCECVPAEICVTNDVSETQNVVTLDVPPIRDTGEGLDAVKSFPKTVRDVDPNFRAFVFCVSNSV